MPQSTVQQRLFAVYSAYAHAYRYQDRDLQACRTVAQATAIRRNVDRLEDMYNRAAKQALDATGAMVEQAMAEANAAQAAVESAYQDARDIADRIRLVGDVLQKVGALVARAGGK